MLAYISLAIGLCNILAVVVFFLAWVELHERIKNSLRLQEDFQAAVRRLMISVGFFGLPILEYLFAGNKRSAKVPEAATMVASYASLVRNSSVLSVAKEKKLPSRAQAVPRTAL